MEDINYLEEERKKIWLQIRELESTVDAVREIAVKKTSDYEKEARGASKKVVEFKNKSQKSLEEIENIKENIGGYLSGVAILNNNIKIILQERYGYYHEKSSRTIKCNFRVKKDELESKFYDYLKSIQPNQEIINLFEAIVIDVYKKQQSEQIKQEFRLEKELEALKQRKKTINDLVIKGTFDDETYKEKIEEVKNEIMI